MVALVSRHRHSYCDDEGGTPRYVDMMPTGTNLFDATQADAMVRYMVAGMPQEKQTTDYGDPDEMSRAMESGRQKLQVGAISMEKHKGHFTRCKVKCDVAKYGHVILRPVIDANPESENGKFYWRRQPGSSIFRLSRMVSWRASMSAGKYYVDFHALPARTLKLTRVS